MQTETNESEGNLAPETPTVTVSLENNFEAKEVEEETTDEFSEWSFRRAISHATLFDGLLLLWAMAIASFVPVVVELSKDPVQKKTLYSTYWLNGCQEFLKCFISFIVFLIICAKEKENIFVKLKQLTFKHWCYFFFASACYAAVNNIDIKVIDHMDPATFQLISRFRLLTTTLVWWLIFRVRINKYQIFALFCIMLGTCIIVLPKLWEPKDDNANGNSVGFDWHGIYLLAIEFIFQAAGSISSEWVLKRDMQMSIWLQGMCMYSWGALINFILFLTMDKERVFMKQEGPFEKFNDWAYVLCIIYCLFGLTIGAVLKRFSTVVKMVCSSFANVSTILLTFCLLKKQVKGWGFIPGACVIILAVALYGFGAQKEKDRLKKLKKMEEKKQEEEEEDIELGNSKSFSDDKTILSEKEEQKLEEKQKSDESSTTPNGSDPDI